MDENTTFQIMSAITCLSVGFAIYFCKKAASSDYMYQKLLEDYFYMSGKLSNMTDVFYGLNRILKNVKVDTETKEDIDELRCRLSQYERDEQNGIEE